jgi:hypothetical protein
LRMGVRKPFVSLQRSYAGWKKVAGVVCEVGKKVCGWKGLNSDCGTARIDWFGWNPRAF